MYVKRKEAGIPWEEKDYTLRGLEEIVRQATQKVPTSQSPRERHAARVLQKVKDLKDCSQEDKDEKVRECSCQSSREDRVRALNRGKQDAVFASTGGSRRSFVVRNMIKSLSRRKLRTVKDA